MGHFTLVDFRSTQRECFWIDTYTLSLCHSVILYFCLRFFRIPNCTNVFVFVFPLVCCFFIIFQFINLLSIHLFIFFCCCFFFYLMILSNFSYFLKFKMINTKCKQRLIYWFLTNKLFTLFSRHFLKSHRFFSLVVTCNGHFVKRYNDIALHRFVCDTL